MGEDFFSTIKGKVNKKVANKIASKIQEKVESMAHDRSAKKQLTEDMSKSGVSLKATLKNDSKVSLGKGAATEKAK